MHPDELKVGMYIDLNCSWFKHPFPRKTFRIASLSQLTTIQGLGLLEVLVDPRQSDPRIFSGPTVPTPSEAIALTGTDERGDSSDIALPAAASYCETVHLATQTYKQMLKRGAKVIKDVLAGSEEGVGGAKVMINALSALIMDSTDSSTIASLFSAGGAENIGTLHAVNVGTLAMIIARHLQLPPDEIKFVGMAGLLHDVGEQRLPVRILRNVASLSKAELREYQRHPDYTVEMLAEFQFPSEVLDLIKCHEERLDGSGYPRQLKGSQLSPAARVLLVVDEYDSLVHKQTPSENLMPAEAIGQLYGKSKTLYPQEVVVALIQTLGVYPPGSIVELSDGTAALVLSLNVESRMRPIVLLYDPSTANDHPRVIDLAQDTSLSIVRNLPKQRLAPAIVSYLDFHRWTGYFIESSLKMAKTSAVV